MSKNYDARRNDYTKRIANALLICIHCRARMKYSTAGGGDVKTGEKLSSSRFSRFDPAIKPGPDPRRINRNTVGVPDNIKKRQKPWKSKNLKRNLIRGINRPNFTRSLALVVFFERGGGKRYHTRIKIKLRNRRNVSAKKLFNLLIRIFGVIGEIFEVVK